MAKRYMIRCDMEGASGIVAYEQAEPGRSEYETGRKRFMHDLNALIRGLYDGGADEIAIYDEHCAGRNIVLEELPALGAVKVFAGKPPYTAESPGGLDGTYDGLILLGFHAKRGSEGCLLQHTYEPDIRDIRIDGRSVGEIGTEALLAAAFGVPLVMVTADSAGIEEARAFGCDGCRYVCVKQSLSEFGAICYPTAVTDARIYAAARAVAETDYANVAKIPDSVKLEIDFFQTPFAAKYRSLYGEARAQGALPALWAEYQARKYAIIASLEKENA